jgi:hypothetical protein
MIGKIKSQMSLYDVGNVFDIRLQQGSFYAQLAEAGRRLYPEDMFKEFYVENVGRPSKPPSDLALICVLQAYEGLSDEDTIEHTAFDLRWCAILRRPAGTTYCAKSTLQLFRAHLVLQEKMQLILSASIKEAKRCGLLKGKLAIAIDTKPIIGRGAVKDTYNLLADGIVRLARELAAEQRQTLAIYLTDAGMERYTASSIKGHADIDWSDDAASQALLTQIVADAKELLRRAVDGSDGVRAASALLRLLLLQDVEDIVDADGVIQGSQIKKGTASGRIPSATDPQQRHGRKSKSNLFTGAKASVATDVDSQIIMAADILSGDAADHDGALDLVKQAEENSGLPVEESLADCAYGDGRTRQEFSDAGRTLSARVPKDARIEGTIPKSAFRIDLDNNQVTCPAGRTTSRYDQGDDGSKTFHFGTACAGCLLRAQCTKNLKGRTIRAHPQERMLQKARAYQQSEAGRKHLRKRVAVEHSLARLAHLGIGQARYFGRAKTRFQLFIACTVANLRRTWNWVEAQCEPRPQLAAI